TECGSRFKQRGQHLDLSEGRCTCIPPLTCTSNLALGTCERMSLRGGRAVGRLGIRTARRSYLAHYSGSARSSKWIGSRCPGTVSRESTTLASPQSGSRPVLSTNPNNARVEPTFVSCNPLEAWLRTSEEVSRVGIEPTTRRLRVPSRHRNARNPND